MLVYRKSSTSRPFRQIVAALCCCFTLLCCATGYAQTTEQVGVDKPVDAENKEILKRGRAKAQGCTRCHGRLGMARFTARSDSGLSVSTYVMQQMLLFRGKRRNHEIMTAVAAPLSGADIYEIALWYESVSQ